MKKILAIVLSIAMLVMAMPFSVFAAETTVATDTWDGTTSTTFAGGSGTETDPYIIETAEQLAGAVLIEEGKFSTANMYFEIAEGSVFDMCGMEGITLSSTASETETATKTTNKWNATTDGAKTFAGNLNGNGVVIYNLYSQGGGYSALIPFIDTSTNTDTTCRISNITLKASYISGYHQSGGIIGMCNGDVSKRDTSHITLDKCRVENCFINDNNNTSTNASVGKTSGGLIGNTGHNYALINNCLIANNDLDATNITGGLIGNTGYPTKPLVINGCVAIGNMPYPVANDGSTQTVLSAASNVSYYTNIYTDKVIDSSYTGITTVTAEQMQGAAAVDNMPGLSWYVNWVPGAEGEYPELYLTNYDYWQGGSDTEWEQDDEGNYIISTADELYGMVYSEGKINGEPANFKVADGVKEIYLSPIKAAVDSGASAESILSSVAASSNNWNNGINGSYAADDGFVGNFDGNGVTIYGMKAVNTFEVGFIPSVKNAGQTTTIKNVAFKYSYVESQSNNPTAAVVVGVVGIDNTVNGTVLNLENVRVENAYFVKNETVGYPGMRAGLCSQVRKSALNVNNCFVADFYGPATAAGICVGSNDQTLLSFKNSVCVNTGEINYQWPTTAENLYSTLAGENWRYANVAAADLAKGVAAVESMPLLDWANTWFATADDYPELRAFHNISAVDNGDGTHSEACADCDIAGAKANHIYDAETGKCTVCPAECFHGFDVDEEKGALEFVVTVPGDCTTPNKGVLQCTICGITDPTEIEDPSGAAGHTKGEAVKENEKAATCTEAGSYDSVVYCSVCKEEVSRETVTVDALGHTDGEVKEENRVESTCTTQGSCDKVTYCSVCGEVSKTENITLELDPENHVYDNDKDIDCNGCGALNELLGKIKFSINDVEVDKGEEFEIVVSVDNNLGIISAKLDIGYDTNMLELVSAAGGEFAKSTESDGEDVDGYNFGEVTANPFAINWTSPLGENVTINGTFAILTFKVKEDAEAGDTAITISCDGENIFNKDLVNMPFETANATVTVKEGLGDVNDDGNIDNKDLGLLMQYINGWDVEINTELAEVYVDGDINNKDYALIMRYINGWDVKLG